MKIGVIQASSQKDKNELLFNSVVKSVEGKDYEVINFGVFKDEEVTYSYIEISVLISILLESKAVDFIVTGCSSGQGMMLACNSLPGVLCGYIENLADAYLFGRINNGNAASFSLGLNFGWEGEINLQCTLDKLFDEPFGIGYPKEESARKIRDTNLLKEINSITKRELIQVLSKMDRELIAKIISKKNVYTYVLRNGKNLDLIEFLKEYINS